MRGRRGSRLMLQILLFLAVSSGLIPLRGSGGSPGKIAGGDAASDQRARVNTTKPGAFAPGVCLLSRRSVPMGGAQRGWVQLCLGGAWKQPDRFQISRSLVVGRSRWRWHLGPGVHRDVPLGPGHLRRCSGRRVSPPGKTTPGTSEIRRECWSRGRIVSALLVAAQGGCRPSMEPPNPVAATMGPTACSSKGCSTSDTGLHGRQRGFMKELPPPSRLDLEPPMREYIVCVEFPVIHRPGGVLLWRRAIVHQPGPGHHPWVPEPSGRGHVFFGDSQLRGRCRPRPCGDRQSRDGPSSRS